MDQAVLPEGFPHKKQRANENAEKTKGPLTKKEKKRSDRDQNKIKISKDQEDWMAVPHMHRRTQL